MDIPNTNLCLFAASCLGFFLFFSFVLDCFVDLSSLGILMFLLGRSQIAVQFSYYHAHTQSQAMMFVLFCSFHEYIPLCAALRCFLLVLSPPLCER